MKHLKKIKKEHIWLSCIVIGPLLSYLAIFSPVISVLALVFIILGIKGILVQIM